MAKYRATAKGYYGDVIHDPETDHHVIFEGPPGMEASWFEEIDPSEKVEFEPVPAISDETETAEAQLDAESEAAAPVVETTELVVEEIDDEVTDSSVPTVEPDDDDIPGETDLDDDTETL